MAKKKVAEEARNTRMATQQPPKQSRSPDVRHGMDLLNREGFNKGTTFTQDERSKLDLHGVLNRQKNIRVLLGHVVDIDPLSKRVLRADDANFEYDSLIVPAGSQTSYYGHDAWHEWARGIKGLEEATNIRHKILYAFVAQRRASHRQGRSGRSRTPLGRYRQEPHAVRQPLLRLSRLCNGRLVVRGEFDVLMRVAAHQSHNPTDAIESLPSGFHRPKHKEHHDVL
jgi:hypothetical protein